MSTKDEIFEEEYETVDDRFSEFEKLDGMKILTSNVVLDNIQIFYLTV